MARNKGLVFLLVGCVLLLVAGGWYVFNIVQDNNAGQQATEILNKMNDVQSNVEKNDDITPVITVDGDTFCGKLVIDKLNVELPVYNEWDYTRLKSAPCRYAGTVATNDIIIAAHNYKSHFGNLNKLQTGDEIMFIDACGTRHGFLVKAVTTLDGTAVTDMKAGEWDFTLFTCTKGGKQRVTVRCDSIKK